MKQLLTRKYFLLFALWSVLTCINLNKAFHIDDTFYLESAHRIKDNPLRPMSGMINWDEVPTPMYTHNPPSGFPYSIALVSGITGFNEIPLHLYLSVFTFFALYFFAGITELLSLENKKLLLVLFALNPAFVINQNLMLDVPILSLILGSLYFLLKASHAGKGMSYSLCALLLSAGILIKYSILPLAGILALVIIIRKEYKYLAVLLIPFLVIAGWCAWNYWEFGAFHMQGRQQEAGLNQNIYSFMACIGAMAPFAVSFISGALGSKTSKAIIYSLLILFIASVGLFLAGVIPEEYYSRYINYAFFITGLIIFIILAFEIFPHLRSLKSFIQTEQFIVLLYAAALAGFIIVFAPFMATRHILLVLPFILLSGADLFMRSKETINRLSIILTIFFGIALGISDRKYANYYRRSAAEISLPAESKIWFTGHWGWQWYSKQKGREQYDITRNDVKEGDYFVFPGDISRQQISSDIELKTIEKKWEEGDPFTLFSGSNFASLYNSFSYKPPWSLSKAPVDTIYVCRVQAVKDTK